MTDTLIPMAFGIVLGALISALGYLVKTRQERNRVFNESLFNLLEIWHQARLLKPPDVDAVLAAYTEEINKRHPEIELMAEDLEGPKIAIEDNAKNLIKELSSKRESSLCDSYSSAISALCKEAPLLAYELNGHQNLKHTFEQFDLYFNQIRHIAVVDDKDEITTEFINHLLKKSSGDAKKTIFVKLEADLISLASFLGKKTKKQVAEKIQIQKEKETNEIKELATDLVQQMETTAKAVVKGQSEKQTSQN